MNFRLLILKHLLCASMDNEIVAAEHEAPKPKDKLAVLPDVLIQHMLGFLDTKDMCSFGLTSKNHENLLKQLLIKNPDLNPVKYLMLISSNLDKRELRMTLKSHSKELIEAFGGIIQIMNAAKAGDGKDASFIRGVDENYCIYYESIFKHSESGLSKSIKISQARCLGNEWVLSTQQSISNAQTEVWPNLTSNLNDLTDSKNKLQAEQVIEFAKSTQMR